MNSTVISFSGRARAGKTTAAEIVKEALEQNGRRVCMINYADYLKFIAAKYFNWDGNKDEKGRTLLQHVGTEWVRSKFPDFWVNLVIEFVRAFDDRFDYFLITDARFPNEINRWKEEGIPLISVLVKRLDYDNGLTPEQKSHPSETALDNFNEWDWVIESKNGMDHLVVAVWRFIWEVIAPVDAEAT